MSDIKNVKLGVCQVLLNGQDLGYTKGGVDVTVKTDTHKVQIDQFGNTPINEYVMGREVSVKVPLAETTLDNMVSIMPGATLYSNGSAATGSITFTTNPSDGMSIVLGGETITFKANGANSELDQVMIGAAVANTATNLATFINTVTGDGILGSVSAAANAGVVTITAKVKGAEGNSFTLNAGTASADVTVSGATLTGGAEGSVMRVDVPVGVGENLLDYSVPLVLHPQNKAQNDHSEDFIVYRAATAGALNFAYDLQKERIFNVDFNGYPDSQGRLFGFGDPAAV